MKKLKAIRKPKMKETNITENQRELTDIDYHNDDYRYKWFCFKPKLCKLCYSWLYIFIVLNICAFTQNLLTSGITTVVISTMEKEFYMASTESGIFLGVFDLAAFISSPIVGFFGGLKRANKMRIIAINSLLMCLGGYVIGFSVFYKKPDATIYSDDVNATLCLLNSSINDCSSVGAKASESLVKSIKAILIIAKMLIGFGSVALYTVGIAYIEDLVPEEKSSICQAIYYAVSALGGGIGILISGQLLNINSRFYYKPYKEQRNNLTTTSTNWIGCWWLPWLLFSFFVNLTVIYIFGFPRKVHKAQVLKHNVENSNLNNNSQITHDNRENLTTLNSSENQNVNRNETANNISQNQNNLDKRWKLRLNNWFIKIIKGFNDFFMDFKIVLLNGAFICLVLASATEGILASGFLGFISKFFEYQYALSSVSSTLVTGVIGIVSVIFGSLLGAFIITKFNFNSKMSSLFISIIYFITGCSFWVLMLSCDQDNFLDVNKLSNQSCLNCNCTNVFDPVCFKSGLNIYKYQSACHVGCITKNNDNYTNCSCIYDNKGLHLVNTKNDVVSFGACDKKIRCLGIMIGAVIVAFFIVFCTAVALIPHLKAVIGTVDIRYQSFALGVRLAIIRVLGNFIGPIIFGSAMDTACIYWKTNCYNQKVCKLYDNQRMSLLLAAIGFTCRFSSCIFSFMAFVFLQFRETREAILSKYLPPREQTVSQVTEEETKENVINENTKSIDNDLSAATCSTNLSDIGVDECSIKRYYEHDDNETSSRV